MPDVGRTVVMVSSLDPAHPAANVFEDNERSYWITTGLYPQEILVAFGKPCAVSSVKLASTHIRGLRIEGCAEDTPLQFNTKIVEEELENNHGSLQIREYSTTATLEFVRVVILSGWHDFSTVHRIYVEGTSAIPGGTIPVAAPGAAIGVQNSSSIEAGGGPGRRPSGSEVPSQLLRSEYRPNASAGIPLEIEIPEHRPRGQSDAQLGDAAELQPDAPRKPDETSAWQSPSERRATKQPHQPVAEQSEPSSPR